MLFSLILLSACVSPRNDTSGYYYFPSGGNGTPSGYVTSNGNVFDSNGNASEYTSDPYGYAESMRNQPPPRDENQKNK